jgi:hypothetical protein
LFGELYGGAHFARYGLAAAVLRRNEAKDSHERLVDLHMDGVTIAIERMTKSSDELSALEKSVVEAEAALDRAKLADPEVDVADIVKIHEVLERLEPGEQAAARALMHEKLKRLIERIDVGPMGYVVRHADGTKTRGARMG